MTFKTEKALMSKKMVIVVTKLFHIFLLDDSQQYFSSLQNLVAIKLICMYNLFFFNYIQASSQVFLLFEIKYWRN